VTLRTRRRVELHEVVVDSVVGFGYYELWLTHPGVGVRVWCRGPVATAREDANWLWSRLEEQVERAERDA
jgi:hypothetical protein